MVLCISTGYRVLGIAYLNQIKYAGQTHIFITIFIKYFPYE